MSAVAIVAWGVYVGGALAMELLWRPAQRHLPPGQTNVVCQRMGRRYRWLALGVLAVAAAATVSGGDVTISLTSGRGRLGVALTACWVLLVGGVTAMAFFAHPALHARTSPSMSAEDRAAARERVRHAIRRMDVLLRLDLAVSMVAVLLAASLASD